MKPKALAAELLGTFMLTLAVLISVNTTGFPIPTPVIAGLTLGLLVYTIGPVSGCHINPAVTIGLFSIGKIEAMSAAGYIAVQIIGAFAALGIGGALFSPGADVIAANTFDVGVAELLGAFVFLFGIASVVLGRVPAVMSGIVIGGSLALGVSFAAHTSNGVLNPAVAFGIGSFSLAYVWGPIVGAVVGCFLSRALEEASTGDSQTD
ncbi:MAG: aquaporin [Gemmatimonadota bacterium]|nr:aquaporin [Gemmatimonadota bacterium]